MRVCVGTLKDETAYGGRLLPNAVVFEEYGEGWVDENDDVDLQRMVARVGEQADVKFS
jgi:hypothetical protein